MNIGHCQGVFYNPRQSAGIDQLNQGFIFHSLQYFLRSENPDRYPHIRAKTLGNFSEVIAYFPEIFFANHILFLKYWEARPPNTILL